MALNTNDDPTRGVWPAGGGHHLIVGPPQSGKTIALVGAFVDFVRTHGPSRAVFLTPTRQGAAALQNTIANAFGGTTGQLLVRTPASLAFGLLRAGAVLAGEPAPTLITGPEQDHVLFELIAGHIEDGFGPAWPEHITHEVLGLRAFRDELRDLLMRAAEAGLDGPALIALGEELARPEWVAAGHLLEEYTAVMLLGQTTPDRGARYDAATIVDRATALITARPDLAGFDAIVHDDYQDATMATSRLLGVLAEHGADLLLGSNPDTGVQGFRGGLPALTRTATLPQGSQDGAFGARLHELTDVHMTPSIWSHLEPIASDLPPLVGTSRRRATPALGPEPVGAGVEAVTVPSTPGEGAYIARRLREMHVLEGIAWSDMALVVRGHHHLARLRRALSAAGVPVRTSGAEVPLREEPVVRAMLTLIDIATTPTGPTLPQVSELLMGPFGGIDSLALRRLRRTLRHHDPTRTSAELLLDAMEDETLRVTGGDHPGLHRIARMLAAARGAITDGAGIDMLLWRIWATAGVASAWQDRALTPGPAAARTDADLDAAVALFTVAEQFVDRRAGAGPRAFLEHLREQDFPADTLAARADRTEAVALHTATSAAGEHWRVVIVAGVQEDTWPDLRLRDTLLGSAALAQVAASGHRDQAASPRGARKEVLADERRMFLAACSRARERLIVTAVLDAETRPSMFFDRIADDPVHITHVPPPLDMRGLVGTLRAELTTGADPERADAATALLAGLAEAGVTEADHTAWNPTWSGQGALEPGTDKPVLSPSMIEQALTCPLQWFLTTHGGRTAESRAQNLGNLIHDIASNHPHGTLAELRAELDERWEELDLPDNHIGAAERERAEGMITQLAQYLTSHQAPAEVEVPFEVDVGPAILKGRVDRVEHRDDGPYVVDFKTGSARQPADVAVRNPQLGAYQLAVEHGAFTDGGTTSAGASLVYLAVNKSVLVREQAPLAQEEEPWALGMVEEAARVVTAAEFPARPSEACAHCPVRSACPAMDEGVHLGEER